MARIRTVKPDAWQDPRVGRLTVPARLLWVVLITMADDAGRFLAMPAVIFGHGYPHDPDSLAAIPGLLDELEHAGLLTLYEFDGVQYGAHPKWAAHQRISHPTPSHLPEPTPERLRKPSANASGVAPEVLRGERKGGDRNGEEGNGTPPPVSAPAPEASPAPKPSAALTCPVEVRDMLLAAGFNPGEIEQADGAIRLTLNQLQLPDDVDWWRYGREINQAREDGKLRRHGPIAALRFVAKGASGPPRLKAGQQRGTAASPVDHYAAMRDAA